MSTLDFGFHFILDHEPPILDGIAEAVGLGVRSFKMFMTYKKRGRRMVSDEFLCKAMERIARLVKRTRDETFVHRLPDGTTVNHTMAIASLGGATLDNEENYLIKKVFSAGLGLVWVENHEAEAVTTGTKGEFTLAAYAAPNQTVRLHFKKDDLQPPPQDHLAGTPVTLVLDRN